MSRELEKTLQILTAVILAGLTIPLWNNNLVHRMIIIGLLLVLAKVMFKIYRG